MRDTLNRKKIYRNYSYIVNETPGRFLPPAVFQVYRPFIFIKTMSIFWKEKGNDFLATFSTVLTATVLIVGCTKTPRALMCSVVAYFHWTIMTLNTWSDHIGQGFLVGGRFCTTTLNSLVPVCNQAFKIEVTSASLRGNFKSCFKLSRTSWKSSLISLSTSPERFLKF